MSYPTPQNNQPQGDSALPVLALVLAFIFPIAGAIIGHVALGQMNRGQIVATNRSLAKAGVILGWVFTGLTFLFIVFYVVVLVWLIDSGYDPYMQLIAIDIHYQQEQSDLNTLVWRSQ